MGGYLSSWERFQTQLSSGRTLWVSGAFQSSQWTCSSLQSLLDQPLGRIAQSSGHPFGSPRHWPEKARRTYYSNHHLRPAWGRLASRLLGRRCPISIISCLFCATEEFFHASISCALYHLIRTRYIGKHIESILLLKTPLSLGSLVRLPVRFFYNHLTQTPQPFIQYTRWTAPRWTR